MRRGASGLYRTEGTVGSWPRSPASYSSIWQPPEVARGAWIPPGGASRLDKYSTGRGSDRRRATARTNVVWFDLENQLKFSINNPWERCLSCLRVSGTG